MVTLLAQGVNLEKQILLRPDSTVGVGEKYNSFASFINLLLPNVFVLAGVILLLLLIFGGFSIIASANNPKGVEKGSQAITGAIIGFVVIFAAYWFIQIIQLITGVQILNTTL